MAQPSPPPSAADLLIDHGDQAVLSAGDGQGDALALLADPQNDELAWLGLGRHQRRVDGNLADFRRKHLFVDNLILLHTLSSSN